MSIYKKIMTLLIKYYMIPGYSCLMFLLNVCYKHQGKFLTCENSLYPKSVCDSESEKAVK